MIPSRLRQAAVGLLGAVSLCVPVAHAAKAGSSMPKLPVIQQVGVVPVQWEGAAGDLSEAKSTLATVFPQAVRSARRFRVMHDDLVAGSWSTPDGRKELVDQFELSGFVSLGVAPRGDVVSLTARLLDPQLKSLLVEMDTVERSWLASAEAGAVTERVEQLVYRLFNRLPVDVSVTSVQGPFVTLSGGSEQGIRAGDEVELVRTRIRSLHPANGTWLEFQKENLGTAQVIEAKNFTAVARLTKLTKDDAVEVGDGARIGAIAARLKFARQGNEPSFKDAGEPSTIIVPPLYYGSQPSEAKAPKTAKLQAKASDSTPVSDEAPEMAQAEPANDDARDQADDKPEPASQSKPESAPPSDSTPDDDSSSGSVWDDFKFTDEHDRWLDDAYLYGGPVWWDVSSRAVNGAGKFPLWLLNSIGAGMTRSLLFKFKLAFGGGVMFGETGKGSYLGYDSFGELYWQDEIDVAKGLINTWKAGGYGRFRGLSVKKDKFGGGDWVRGGMFAGLGGLLDLQENGKYDWFGEFALMPLNVGRFGYNGKMELVESSMGWQLKLGAFQHTGVQQVQYGGALGIGDERMTLKNGQRPQMRDYSLQAMARYAF